MDNQERVIMLLQNALIRRYQQKLNNTSKWRLFKRWSLKNDIHRAELKLHELQTEAALKLALTDIKPLQINGLLSIYMEKWTYDLGN